MSDAAFDGGAVGDIELHNDDSLCTQCVGVGPVAAGDVAHGSKYTVARAGERLRGVAAEQVVDESLALAIESLVEEWQRTLSASPSARPAST